MLKSSGVSDRDARTWTTRVVVRVARQRAQVVAERSAAKNSDDDDDGESKRGEEPAAAAAAAVAAAGGDGADTTGAALGRGTLFDQMRQQLRHTAPAILRRPMRAFKVSQVNFFIFFHFVVF